MSRESFGYELIKSFVIFLAGGFIYGLIEIIYRGNTHPSMFVLGGLCLLWIGGAGRFFRVSVPMWLQVLLGGLFITLAEFSFGLIYNIWLGLKVWDYSKLPFNIMGQICPMFFFLWVAISLPAILIESLFRASFSRGGNVAEPDPEPLS